MSKKKNRRRRRDRQWVVEAVIAGVSCALASDATATVLQYALRHG